MQKIESMENLRNRNSLRKCFLATSLSGVAATILSNSVEMNYAWIMQATSV